jgi:hypothetical protein
MFIYMYTVLRGQVKTMMLAQQRKESPLNLLPAELIYQVTSSKAPSHTARSGSVVASYLLSLRHGCASITRLCGAMWRGV